MKIPGEDFDAARDLLTIRAAIHQSPIHRLESGEHVLYTPGSYLYRVLAISAWERVRAALNVPLIDLQRAPEEP